MNMDQNKLAYMLADELHDTARKFSMTHRDTSINAMLGAANIFLGTWLAYAPSKKKALEGLDMCVGIIRGMIEQTPDGMFGGNNANPNFMKNKKTNKL